MREKKIRDFPGFRLWVQIRLLEEGMTQKQLAKRMGVVRPRITEATFGKQSGRKYVEPIIRELGGDTEDFRELLKAT